MRNFVFVAVLIAVLMLAGCHESRAPVEISGPTMGTRYHITIARPPNAMDAEVIQREINTELGRINAQMSTYLPDSEISKFNQFAGAEWFAVSPPFAAVVRRALRFSVVSDGAFDVTVRPLVNQWNLGSEESSIAVPSDAEIEIIRRSVGYRLIDVRDEPPALRKQRPGVQIDLSAIAKGFAVDRVTEMLESHSLDHFMVEIGGEVRVKGTNTEGIAWAIGIEKPVADQRVLQRVLRLCNVALATSGDYRNFVEIDGRRYSHAIDPRTGHPVDHRLASVSVIAADCLSADAWATALLVLGPADGYDLARQEGLATLFIERATSGFVERATPAFDDIVAQIDGTVP